MLDNNGKRARTYHSVKIKYKRSILRVFIPAFEFNFTKNVENVYIRLTAGQRDKCFNGKYCKVCKVTNSKSSDKTSRK